MLALSSQSVLAFRAPLTNIRMQAEASVTEMPPPPPLPKIKARALSHPRSRTRTMLHTDYARVHPWVPHPATHQPIADLHRPPSMRRR